MLTEDSGHEMARLLAARWWAVLRRGTISIAFGALALAWLGVTVATLVLRFGFLALADGLVCLRTATGGCHQRQDRWLLLLEVIVGISAGVVTLRAPALTALVLVLVVSIWAISNRIVANCTGCPPAECRFGLVWLVLSGILPVLFALLLLLRPAVGILGLVWVERTNPALSRLDRGQAVTVVGSLRRIS